MAWLITFQCVLYCFIVLTHSHVHILVFRSVETLRNDLFKLIWWRHCWKFDLGLNHMTWHVCFIEIGSLKLRTFNIQYNLHIIGPMGYVLGQFGVIKCHQGHTLQLCMQWPGLCSNCLRFDPILSLRSLFRRPGHWLLSIHLSFILVNSLNFVHKVIDSWSLMFSKLCMTVWKGQSSESFSNCSLDRLNHV